MFFTASHFSLEKLHDTRQNELLIVTESVNTTMESHSGSVIISWVPGEKGNKTQIHEVLLILHPP